jgi:hypothetical protein
MIVPNLLGAIIAVISLLRKVGHWYSKIYMIVERYLTSIPSFSSELSR